MPNLSIRLTPVSAPAPPAPTPIADLRSLRVRTWLDSRELAASTKANYEVALRQFIAWLPDGRGFDWVKQATLVRYREHLKESLKPGAVGTRLSAIQSFFSWMTANGYLSANPAQQLDRPKVPKAPPQYLTAEQIAGLKAILPSLTPRDFALAWVAAHGLRVATIAALNIQDLQEQCGGPGVVVRQDKRDSGRYVPFSSAAQSAIDSWLAWRMREGFSGAPENALFVSLSNNNLGKRITTGGIRAVMRTWAQFAGLESLRPHQWRHTYCTILIESGMPVELAMQLTGHKNITSLNVYAGEAQARAAIRDFRSRDMGGRLL